MARYFVWRFVGPWCGQKISPPVCLGGGLLSVGLCLWGVSASLLPRVLFGLGFGGTWLIVNFVTVFYLGRVRLAHDENDGFCGLSRAIAFLTNAFRAGNCLVYRCEFCVRISVSRALFDFAAPGRFVAYVCFREVTARAPANGFRTGFVRANHAFRAVDCPYAIRSTVVLPFARFVVVRAFCHFVLINSNGHQWSVRVSFHVFMEEDRQDFSANRPTLRFVSQGVVTRTVLRFGQYKEGASFNELRSVDLNYCAGYSQDHGETCRDPISSAFCERVF